jgi:hypothetical protein
VALGKRRGAVVPSRTARSSLAASPNGICVIWHSSDTEMTRSCSFSMFSDLKTSTRGLGRVHMYDACLKA